MQFLVFVVALVTSATFTRWLRDFSIARGWTSVPSSDRHVHTRPIPRLGGVAIFLTLWCMVLLAHWVPGHFGTRESPLSHFTLKIMEPATIVFLLGLIDDFCGLSACLKFAVQAGAAVLLFWNGFGISQLSILAGHSHLGWLVGLPLTILWVLWITNAFNLIDGLDGLAAGSALFSTLVTCVVALLSHNEVILFLTLALSGAIAGFLRYNFNPAPILDVAVAVIRRFLSCKQLFGADREHIHHKLLGRGVSHRQAVLVLYGVSACFGLLSLLLLNPGGTAAATVLVVVGLGVLIGVQQLRYHEFLELGRLANRTVNQRQVIANDISIRRAADTVNSCTKVAEFCHILQECLEPVGFDGFGLYLSSEVPVGVELCPFTHASRSKLNFFWDSSLTSSETNWSLTFSLLKKNGRRLGGFTLYRKSTASPLWMDLDVFTATGFSTALAAVVEKMQDSWFMKSHEEKMPSLKAVAPSMMASNVHESIVVPS